jgi:hypothetical protein
MAIQNSELQRSGRTLDLVVLGLLLCLGGLLVPAATLEQTEQRWLQAKPLWRPSRMMLS